MRQTIETIRFNDLSPTIIDFLHGNMTAFQSGTIGDDIYSVARVMAYILDPDVPEEEVHVDVVVFFMRLVKENVDFLYVHDIPLRTVPREGCRHLPAQYLPLRHIRALMPINVRFSEIGNGMLHLMAHTTKTKRVLHLIYHISTDTFTAEVNYSDLRPRNPTITGSLQDIITNNYNT